MGPRFALEDYMVTINSVKSDMATDGRLLVRVTFSFQSDRADEPDYEAIYTHVKSDDQTLTFLSYLSCTRTDTREPLDLPRQMGEQGPLERIVREAVVNHIADSESEY